MAYSVSRTGLVHRDGCALLEPAVARCPDRAEALRRGVRMARCCAHGRVATVLPVASDPPDMAVQTALR